MRALLVFESMFGNTREIALAVADGLRSGFEVEVGEAGSVSPILAGPFDLLVVGGPTHAFSMSRPGTRQSAVEQGAPVGTSRRGIREWLDELEPGLRRPAVATFDTRVAKPRLPGSAARGAARRLRSHGLTLAAAPESFYVDGTTGPLLEGETDRARRWAESLVTRVATKVPAGTA